MGRPTAPAGDQNRSSSRPKGFDDYDVSLGDLMRGERATMGKSLLDVQRDLKIKATYIAAIENADPTAFDTPGFVAGYVRSYARYLNLDPDWAYEKFCSEGGFENPQGLASAPPARKAAPSAGKSSTARPRDPFTEPSVSFIPATEAPISRIEPAAVASVAVVVALIGGIGYGGWSVLQEIQKVRFTPVDQAPGVLSELDPLDSATAGSAMETATATTEAFDRLYRPQALDVPVLVARDAPIATLDPSEVGVLTPEALAPPRPPQMAEADRVSGPAEAPEPPVQTVQVVEDPEPELVLFAVRPAWVRVRAADGTVIFEKILDAGERFVLPNTEEPPVLRAGNAGSVYFAVNGETYGPAGSGASIAREVVLSADALTGAYAVADLSEDADLARFVAVAEAMTEEPPAE